MGLQVVVEQVVPAPPGVVFASWTSADEMAKWWWPHIPDTTYEIDARPGGAYRIESEIVGIGVEGEFASVSAPDELVLTWRWLTRGSWQVEEPVRVRFTGTDGGTLVTVTHELDDMVESGDDIGQGWRDVLVRLAGIHT